MLIQGNSCKWEFVLNWSAWLNCMFGVLSPNFTTSQPLLLWSTFLSSDLFTLYVSVAHIHPLNCTETSAWSGPRSAALIRNCMSGTEVNWSSPWYRHSLDQKQPCRQPAYHPWPFMAVDANFCWKDRSVCACMAVGLRWFKVWNIKEFLSML